MSVESQWFRDWLDDEMARMQRAIRDLAGKQEEPGIDPIYQGAIAEEIDRLTALQSNRSVFAYGARPLEEKTTHA